MALSLKKLSNLHRTVEIPFDGDVLHVTYRLPALNSKLADWVDEHGSERRSIQEWLTQVVADWDFLEEDGRHMAVEVESMDRHDIPTSLFILIKIVIQEDASPLALRKSFTAT
jgi:hypothetical protein